MNSSANLARRREKDVTKLLMSEFDVCLVDENSMKEIFVVFNGPKDSPYEGGIWKIYVHLPEQYPYKSPSIGFYNKIFHPNIDETSGSVCLDVINQTWSPMYNLINIFDTFLPQLLLYPNPTDPLNGEAARLQIKSQDKYNEKVVEHTKKHANDAIILNKEKEKSNNIEKLKKKESVNTNNKIDLLKDTSNTNNNNEDKSNNKEGDDVNNNSNNEILSDCSVLSEVEINEDDL